MLSAISSPSNPKIKSCNENISKAIDKRKRGLICHANEIYKPSKKIWIIVATIKIKKAIIPNDLNGLSLAFNKK